MKSRLLPLPSFLTEQNQSSRKPPDAAHRKTLILAETVLQPVVEK